MPTERVVRAKRKRAEYIARLKAAAARGNKKAQAELEYIQENLS